MHRANEQFWGKYNSLPDNIREVADRSFALLKCDAYHPSLQFKKVGTLWSVRVGRTYRALAVKDGQDYIWVWIGKHDEYQAMINKRQG